MAFNSNKTFTEAEKKEFSAKKKTERENAYKGIDSATKSAVSGAKQLNNALAYMARNRQMTVQNAFHVLAQTKGAPAPAYSVTSLHNELSDKYYIKKGEKSKITVFEETNVYTDKDGNQRTGTDLVSAFTIDQLIDKKTGKPAEIAPDRGLRDEPNPELFANAVLRQLPCRTLKTDGRTEYDAENNRVLINSAERTQNPKVFASQIALTAARAHYAADAKKYPTTYENPKSQTVEKNVCALLSAQMLCFKYRLSTLDDNAMNSVCKQLKSLPTADARAIISRASRVENALDSKSMRIDLSKATKELKEKIKAADVGDGKSK